MIYTSYYSIAKYLPGKIISVSVSTPKGIKVDGEWPSVIPPWNIVEKYKQDGNEEAYTKAYLDYLERQDLREDIKYITSLKDNVFLLCYEAPDKFCHRHLLAKYLKEKFGISITEYREVHSGHSLGFCENCKKEVKYTVTRKPITKIFQGVECKYIEQEAICPHCDKAIYVQQLQETNAEAFYNAYYRHKKQ